MTRRNRRAAASAKARESQQPSMLPIGSSFSSLRINSRFWQIDDAEEFPSRAIDVALPLIELVNFCPEVAAALESICAYTFSSGAGDELGFAVVVDEKNPKPSVVKIARSVLSRIDLFTYYQIVWRMLAWGNAFGLLDIDTKEKTIASFNLLPSWQIHVMPDRMGNVTGYEQRWGNATNIVTIPPANMIHWSYNKRYLYGRSLFHECISDWEKLKDIDIDLSDASRSASIQPNLHIMQPGADEAYKRAYKEDHERRRKAGLITDIYLMQGADVRKPQGLPTSFPLQGLLNHFDKRRLRIAARSRVPPYLLGIESKSAKEIAMQPAISYMVFIGVVRQLFCVGLRQLINTELALKEIPEANWVYKLQFPTININPYHQLEDTTDVNEPGVSDTDALGNAEQSSEGVE
jgi:hypothetical protein